MTRRPPFFWIVLGLGGVLLASVPLVVHALIAHGGGLLPYRGWRGSPDAPTVAWVDAQGPAAGRLAVGDRLLAVNGDNRLSDLAAHFAHSVPGAAYAVSIERGGASRVVPLVMGERLHPWPSWLKAQFVLLAVAYLTAGLFLGLMRPEEKSARLFAAGCLLGAAVFLTAPAQMPPIPPPLLPVFEAVLLGVLWLPFPLMPALVYSAYLRFPPGIAPGRAWRVPEPFFWVWGAVLCAWLGLDTSLDLRGPAARVAFATAHPLVWRVGNDLAATLFPYIATAALAGVAVLVRNYRSVRTVDQRRRVQWFVWGTAVASAPMTMLLVGLAVTVVLGRSMSVVEGWGRVFAVANVLSLLSPISLAYSILQHDILDVRLALRAGVQHLLARGLLRVVVLAPLVLLVGGVVANPDRTVREMVVGQPHVVALAALGALGLRFRERLAAWVDRRFFREAYDAQQVLVGLSDALRGQDSLDGVARVVAAHVDEAFHPRHVQVFWRDEATSFAVGHSSGSASVTGTVSDVSALVRLLEGSGQVRELRGAEAADAGVEEPGLAVPIGGGERRLGGFLLLGPRRSESPYTREDRGLLAAIAAQLAIVHENDTLRRRASIDARARQEVLARLEGSGVNLLKECAACGACYDRDAETCAEDGTALRLTLPVDRTIDGKYRLERLLGRGGMGAVYEASDLRLARRVAVKVMTGASFGNEDALRRFEREARASARLDHPNIITVFDYGQLAAAGAYLVMERLNGTTLRSALPTLDNVALADVFAQMLDGVAAAHRAGVVHRDLKPENVFLAVDGKGSRAVKVLDFGLAKLTLADAESGGLTAEGAVMGTLAYMSPEQLQGQPVDVRTDVFAIGVMAAEAATGRHPFRGADTTETVAAILGARFHLDAEGPEAQALAVVLERCLARDRSERYASVGELAPVLVAALRACPPLRGHTPATSVEQSTRARPAGA